MKKQRNIIFLILLCATTWIVYKFVFISEEDRILKTINTACDLASFSKVPHPIEKLKRAKKLSELFTTTIQITVMTETDTKKEIYGKDNIQKHSTLSYSQFQSLKFSVKKPKVKITGNNASVDLEVSVISKKEGDTGKILFQEKVRVDLIKQNQNWLISSARNLELL